MINNYLQKNQKYNEITKKINSKFPNLDTDVIKKEIILSDLINFLNAELFKKNNINWILCGGTNLSKCHNLIDRISEDLDILIIEKSNTQAKKIIPTICKELKKLENENFSIDLESQESHINERNFIKLNLKIKLNKNIINYSLEIISTNLTLYKSTKKELLSLFDILFPSEKNTKIIVDSLNPTITIAEKIIKIHKLLVNVNDKKIFLNKRDLRHFYDIYSWYKKRKNDCEILKLKNIYKEILDNKPADSSYFDNTNILNNKLFITDLNFIKKDLNTFLKTEVYEEKNFSKSILDAIKEIKKFYETNK